MKLKVLMACMLCSMGLLTACGPGIKEPRQEGYHKITPREAKDRLSEGNVTLVDVRTAEEFYQNHIPGAILIPNESITDKRPEPLPEDWDTVLLIYCRSGRRSKQAAEKLAAIGYRNVYDFGGIIDWPYETVTGEE